VGWFTPSAEDLVVRIRWTDSIWLSGRPPGAVAWIGNTKGTVKPSKTSMSILWSAMLGSVYAAIPRGREPGDENAGHQ